MITVLDSLKKIVSEQLDVDIEKITMDSSITEDLGADSLDTVDLIMSIEEQFDIEIPDEAVENIKTIGDIVNYIEANQE